MLTIQFSEDRKKRRVEKFFLYAIGGTTLFILFCLVFGLLIQWLWNATIASMFGLAAISYWQAVGMFILAKFFFGFGGAPSPQKKRKVKKHENQNQQHESGEVTELAADKGFRNYWEQEGKAAYTSFLSSRTDRPSDEVADSDDENR